MRKVLIVACYFPPYGGMGCQRALKFVKYLPQNEWMPTVLTVKEKKTKEGSPSREEFYKHKDPSLLKDIPPEVLVHRTPILEPTLFLKKMFFRGVKKISSVEPSERLVQTKRNIFFKYLRTFLDFPDHEIGWLPFALHKGLQVIKNEDIDIIFTTSPPHSIHIIGYFLKCLTKKPWVVDFRDPWTREVWFNPATPLRRRMEEGLEKRILKYADKIICNTEPMKEDFIKSYSDIPKNNFEVITNGFDKEDFQDLEKKPQEKFTITYTGTMCISFDAKKSVRYNPIHFFKALRNLLDEKPELENKIQVNFVVLIREELDVSNLIKKLNLENILRIYQFLSHQECMKYLVNSDALLLIHHAGGKSKDWVPAKLYEYLGAGKPVLALIPQEQGAAYKILEETKAGIMTSSDNVNDIKEAIYKLYLNHQDRSCFQSIDVDKVFQYERSNLTKKLTEVFNGIIK
ncbi:MAG: glycosyltransferase family 4 protein [bacterium]|nr:glycosyltransferase family 4 protein [bacterium]